MKRFTILFMTLVALLMTSCTKKKTTYTYIPVTYPVEQWFSQYIREHPYCLDSDSAQKKAAKDLLQTLKDTANGDFYEDIPVVLRKVCREGENNMAQFSSNTLQRGLDYTKPLAGVNFDIIVNIPDSVVKSTKENELYLLKIEKIDRLDSFQQARKMLGCTSTFSNYKVGLRKDSTSLNKVQVDLGIYYGRFLGLEKFIGRRKVQKYVQ